MMEFDVEKEGLTENGEFISDILRGYLDKAKGITLPEGNYPHDQGCIGNLCVFTVQNTLFFFIPTVPHAFIQCSSMDKRGYIRELNGKYPCLLLGHKGSTFLIRVIV